jgi:hypothetical protein
MDILHLVASKTSGSDSLLKTFALLVTFSRARQLAAQLSFIQSLDISERP